MNQQPPTSTATPNIGVDDILFTIFRHKWKLIVFFFLGIAAAAVIFVLKKPLFVSDAKFLVKYVTESKGPNAGRPDTDVRAPDLRGTAILSAEVEILTSGDCIIGAVRRLGAGRVLSAYGGGTNENAAAAVLGKGLKVTVGNSGVIWVSLGHRDPEVAQASLNALLKEYLERHVEVHLASGTYEFLQNQTLQVRQRLAEIEDELRKEKNKAGIVSLPEAKADVALQTSSLRKLINEAEAELADHDAQLDAATGANQRGTNTVATGIREDAGNPATPFVRRETLAEYRRLTDRLSALKAQDQDLRKLFLGSSRQVAKLGDEIKAVETSLNDLGIDPATIFRVTPTVSSPGILTKGLDVETERSHVAGLRAKINMLKEQFQKAQTEATKIENSEGAIQALQRQRDLTEDLYTYFSKNLERIRIDQTVDITKVNNISTIQEPTIAGQDFKSLYKKVGMAFAGCVGAGLALAFALDFLLDPSVKRSKEVENSLRLPLIVSVPDFGRNGRSKLRRPQQTKDASEVDRALTREIEPWSESDPMLPYYEALRDRIVMSYSGDLHIPKIVAVTSCNKGAGVSRIATGLAAALSRDVQRNVLFIALERNKVAVSAFDKGCPTEVSSRVSETPAATGDVSMETNLHCLATTGRNVAGASIVQSFSDLIPKLRKSEYDYIIFDLPPITETSGSLRLASQVERTILVIEAEETRKENVIRVRNLLSSSQTSLFSVLNRTKAHGIATNGQT